MAKVRDEKDIVEMFESQYTRSEDKFSAVKKSWKEENDFSLGIQWDATTRGNRSVQGEERPCITVNKIDPLVHRIVNEAKQQKLEATIKPVDDSADPDTALILAGLVRNTEYVSNAVRAYMWSYECAVRAGLGYHRVINCYEDDDSFDQTVRIKRIRNPICVSFDPDSEEQNGSDATFAIISDEISKISAENLCRDVGYDSSNIIPDRKIWLCDNGAVRHGELEWEERESDTLYQLKDLSTVRASDLAKEQLDVLLAMDGAIIKSRKVDKKTIWYANIVEGKVIEKVKKNSKYISVVRMVGREGYIDGKVDYRGITRNSMDANRMYNVMSSLLVERIGLAPRAPYIGVAGQFEGYEDQWQNANNRNLAKLEYNAITINGQLAPAPQKNDAASGDPTIERYMMIAANDIKDTSSISDAFMGSKSNETSGAGIKARASQSGLATYDFLDNAADSIEHTARITIDMYPRILRPDQAVRILGDDYREKIIKLNAFKGKDGEVKSIDLSIGKFDCEVTATSGDKTRREAAIEQLSFVLQTNPQAAAVIMDVFVGNLDIKDADKVAKRFKALLPPEVIAAEEQGEKDNPELDALQKHAEQIISQLKAQLEECSKQLQDAQLQLKNKDGELNIKQQEVDLKAREVDIKAKEADGKSPSMSSEEVTQLRLAIRKIYDTEQELGAMHQEMDMVLKVLEQLKGQEAASGEPTLPQNASTEGNGTPPVEAETNVGETNG